MNLSAYSEPDLSLPGERRRGLQSIPLNVHDYLTEDQSRVLGQVERFGWQLLFVRRSLLHNPTVVIRRPDTASINVIECDGTLSDKLDLRLRELRD